MALHRRLVLLLLVLCFVIIKLSDCTSTAVTGVTPNTGSLNGGTRLTIDGTNFAGNQFNFGDGNEHLGNTVTLVSGTQQFDCPVHKDGTHETQIMCYTEPMPAGDYHIRVSVDGNDIPEDNICSGCKIRISASYSPTITDLNPVSGVPGTLLKISGKIVSDKFGSNIDESSNGIADTSILRVYVGGPICELKDGDDFYGIELDNGGTSTNGYMTCKIGTFGTKMGNINASFIISGAYGRSQPDMSLYKVSRNYQLYMFQTYAEVTSITPSTGSVEGGTLLSIAGNNFDQSYSSASVSVGGTDCLVEGDVTSSLITCRTAAQPSPVPTHTGNRGMILEYWNETSKTHALLSDVLELNSSASDYYMSVVDEASFTDDTMDNFVSKVSGFFVPPFDGQYSLHILADDGAELFFSTDHDPANKAKVAETQYSTNYNRYTSQSSSRMTLSKDNSYYMEVLHRDVSSGANVRVAARYYDTNLTSSYTGNAIQESQKIEVRSQITREVQELSFTGFQERTPTQEVQEITVEDTGSSGGTFRLSLYTVFTEEIAFRADSADVANAISRLPFFESDETISVADQTTATGGVKYTVSFTTDRGDFDLFKFEVTGTLQITVAEATKGVPSGKKVSLVMANIPAPLLLPTASSSEVQTAFETLFITRCPSILTIPSRKTIHLTFESGSTIPSYVGGSLVSDMVAFCGRTVVKNPYYLFRAADDPLSITQNPKLCFAHQGGVQGNIRVSYTYMDQNGDTSDRTWGTLSGVVSAATTTGWHYSCVDLYTEISALQQTGSSFSLMSLEVFRSGDLYVDDVYFGKSEPTTDYDGIILRRLQPSMPGGNLIDTVTVADNAGKHEVTLVPFDCGYNLDLFAPAPGHIPSGANVNVVQIQTASPPIGGTFSVTFLGDTVSEIPATSTTEELKAMLENIENIGSVSVSKIGTCANFDWTVTFNSLPGDQSLIQVDGSTLTGTNVTMTALNNIDGYLLIDPIPGELLRTHHSKHQVMVMINDVPTKCSGNCAYEWLDSSTPKVTGVSPGTGNPNTQIVITGTGFSGSSGDNSVTIGGVGCLVTSSSSTSITCNTQAGPDGIYKIEVNVDGYGIAQHSSGDVNFIYSTDIDSISPSSGSLGGGISLTVNGYGFRSDATVSVGEQACPVSSYQHDQLVCTVPASTSAGSVSVEVSMPGVSTVTSSTSFAYDSGVTAQITSISPSTSGVKGGDVLTITGTGFGSSGTLIIGGTEVTPLSYNSNEVTATLPVLSPRTHTIQLIVGSNGAAVLSSNSVPSINYLLKVTNVHPLRGSLYGGTQVTLTGEGFYPDTEITIGGHDCVVESSSATKLVCKIRDTANVHVVDNQGAHFAFGIGYAWNPENLKIRVGDKVRWSWHYPTWVSGMTPRLEQTPNATAIVSEPDGFSSGSTGTKSGSYEHRFTNTGTYYFWSGYVDIYTTTWFRGSVTVESLSSYVGDVSVMVQGVEAEYDINSGVANPADNGPCVGTLSTISGCSDSEPTGGDASKFNFKFWSCVSPKITSISRRNGTASSDIELTGEGLSITDCQNEIKFGSDFCTPSSSSSSSVTCRLDTTNSPPVGIQQALEFRVGNLGNALMEINGQVGRTFTAVPVITGLSPTLGSRGGSTQLTIGGAGFEGSTSDVDVVAKVDGYLCAISSLTYTQIICFTPIASADGNKNVTVEVNVRGSTFLAECDGSCEFIYETASTPALSSVTPASIDGSATTLTISGSRFGSVTADVSVAVGGEQCTVSSTSDSEIQCTVTNVPVGSQALVVTVSGKGKAIHDPSTVEVTSQAMISGVSPTEGSTNGGTDVTVTGNGFDSTCTIQIDGADCPVVSVSLSQIVCKTAAHAEASSLDLIIQSSGPSYTTQTFAFTSSATPEITSVNPTTGSSGDTITIAGQRFGSTNSDNEVMLGGRPCTVTSSSSTEIQCEIGNYRAGSYELQVDVTGKGLSNNDVMFSFTMSASSISPNSGSTEGDQTVTISGSGFDNETMVTICNQECVIFNSSETQIKCITPAAATTVVSTHACNAVVTTNSVTQTLQYTYDSSLTPEITNVSPERGGTGGGTTLTVTGTGFGSNPAACVVSIDGSACIISTITDVQIVCVTEAHVHSVRAKVRVEVSGQGKAKQISANFHYVDVWSSVFTWGGVSVPTDGELVVIQSGQTIYLDTVTAQLKMLLIQGGELIFDDQQDVELKADNILVTNGGLFQVGTEANPFQHKAKITLYGHHRTKELPIYGTKSLAIREGILDLHGTPTPITWTKLAATAAAGSQQIILKDEVTWQVGDEIVIATTGHRHSQSQNEKHKITAVAGDKKTLILESPLANEHISVTEHFGTSSNQATLEFAAEVGLLTHNVVVQGTSHEEWIETIEACPDGFDTGEFATQTCFLGRFGEEMGSDQFGAQVMMHAPEPSKNLTIGRIEYIEFFHVGQAFRLGRYPVHFHLTGDMSHSYVRGCAIHESFNRAVNVHGTHNALIERNVIYNVMGGAFFLEDGIETGNTFQYNLGVFVRESSSLLNDDVTPATFWATNPNNTYQHNAAAGGSHFGFWYRMHDHPEGPSLTTTVCPKIIPLAVFHNNSAHSFGWFGLWIFPTYTPKLTGACGSSSPTPAVFSNFFSWNNEKGIEFVNAGALQVTGAQLVNNEKAGYEGKLLVDGEHYTNNAPLIENSLIVGYGSQFPSQGCTNAGVVLAYGFGFVIRNVEFVNFDSSCSAISWTRIDGTCGVNCGGFLYHTTGLTFTNADNYGIYAWQFEGVIEDLDGSLCGSSNCKVVPSTGSLPPSCTTFSNFNRGIPASVCPTSVKFHRFAFTGIKPAALEFKRAIFTNDYGSSFMDYRVKAITHKPGWMVNFVDGESYNLTFENAAIQTNLSFSGTLYQFENNDFMYLKQVVNKKPDRLKSDDRGFINASETALDPATHYHGDWTFNENTNEITILISARTSPNVGKRRKRGSPALTTGLSDISFNFQAFKCFYTDCIPPPDPNTIPPSDTRPDSISYWSNATSWPNNTLPVNGDDITIDVDTWMIADTTLPWLNQVIVYGALEFDHGTPSPNYRDFVFNATHIIILGGRLIIGWPNQPFLGTAQIILRGSWSTPEYVELTNAPTVGSKVIGVFGGLDLHGKDPGVYWTRLASTANAGDTTLTLKEAVNWTAGNDIVLSTTSYDMWETETFRITAVSSDGLTLTLNSSVLYKHVVHIETINGITIDLGAEVGLLSRNIQIIGEDYTNLFRESFGARVLVGLGTKSGSTYGGYARVENVQFFHTGQEGYTEFYDARYSITYLDAPVTNVKPSYVRKNAFHNGFSPAIGVYGSSGLVIEDNVIYLTVWWGIETSSSNTVLRRNLLSLMVWEGSYQDRMETTNFRWSGAINAMEATNLVIDGNVVSGSERSAYRVPGVECGSVVAGSNMAHSSLFGFAIFPEDELTGSCHQISNRTAWKCRDTGIYYQNGLPAEISNNVLVENTLGAVAFVIGPSAVGHQFENKTVLVKNNLFVGATDSFDCTADLLKSDENIALSGQGRTWNTGGSHIGFAFTNFMQGSNNMPFKPHYGAMSYPAIMGLTKLEDVTFAHFNTKCGREDYAVTSNKKTDDGMHPIESRRMTLTDVSTANKIHYHRPNVGKINSADCVDMDCDAMKKVLFKDEDGTFLGSSLGAVIPQSEFEWDGDARRGLGDYRIPKEMLTRLDGSRIPVNDIAPNKGVIRNSNCVYHTGWQAYECHDLDYEMLIIESMDADTETRRLSPVAILGDGYLDLINGPQDHGWCSGYTCRKRLSTFMALVATGKDYLMHFTSTSPQNLRFFLLNSNASQSITLGIWYSQPNRRDVSVDGTFIMPKNGRMVNDAYILDPPTYTGEFLPNVTESSGQNFFDRDSGILYLTIRGNQKVEIKTADTIIVSFQFPAMTVDEFFGENIIQNLAAFFDLPPNKVRLVKVVRETTPSGRRRKRSTQSDEVIVEIGDTPTDSNPLSQTQLQNVTNTLVNTIQLHNISEVVNATVTGVSYVDVLPAPGTNQWNATTTDSPYTNVVEVSRMNFHQAAVPLHEGVTFQTQPKIQVLDAQGQPITQLGTTMQPWQVTASLASGSNSLAELKGNLTVEFVNGWANFTDLLITQFGTDFIIQFNLTIPEDGNLTISSDPLTIDSRPITSAVTSITSTVVENEYFAITLELRDEVTSNIIEDIAWRGHTWTLTAELYTGSLLGSNLTTFSSTTSSASFYSLKFASMGFYLLKLRVYTTPSAYDFYHEILVTVKTQAQVALSIEQTSQVVIKFDSDYSSVVGSDANEFSAYMGNYLAQTYPDIILNSLSIAPGSIVVTFSVSGGISGVNNTVYSLCSSIQNNTGFTFNSYTLTLSGYLTVGGTTYYGVSCGPTSTTETGTESGTGANDTNLGLIIALSVVSTALVCIVIGILVWKCKVHPKTKTRDLSNYANYFGRENTIEDILFREKSFMSLRDRNCPTPQAPMATDINQLGMPQYHSERKIPLPPVD